MRSIDDIQQIFSIDVQPTLLCGYQKRTYNVVRHVLFYFLWSRNLAHQLKSVVFSVIYHESQVTLAKFLPSMEPRVHSRIKRRVVTLKLQPWKWTAGTQNYPNLKRKIHLNQTSIVGFKVFILQGITKSQDGCATYVKIWVYPEKVTENSTSFCHSKTPNKKGWHHFFTFQPSH